MYTIKLLKRFLLVILILASTSNFFVAQSKTPISVRHLDPELLKDLPYLVDAKVAYFDLSLRKHGPKISIVSLKGEQYASFYIPEHRYQQAWTHWGPGVSFDKRANTLWYLAPKVGLTEFDLGGGVLRTLDYTGSSHQVQLTQNGTFVMPNSWDEESEAQVTELNSNGDVIFQWFAKTFLQENAYEDSVAPSQPKSFTATTSAVKAEDGTYFVSLSQKNLIVQVDRHGKVTWQKRVEFRPHTLAIVDGKLVGYSARRPNRLVLLSETCNCFKEVVLEEKLAGHAQSRTLTLQYLGRGKWFTSGVSGLYIIDAEGKIYWHFEHDGLRGRPVGFHSAVLFVDRK